MSWGRGTERTRTVETGGILGMGEGRRACHDLLIISVVHHLSEYFRVLAESGRLRSRSWGYRTRREVGRKGRDVCPGERDAEEQQRCASVSSQHHF